MNASFQSLSLSLYVYIHTYIHTHTHRYDPSWDEGAPFQSVASAVAAAAGTPWARDPSANPL